MAAKPQGLSGSISGLAAPGNSMTFIYLDEHTSPYYCHIISAVPEYSHIFEYLNIRRLI
jgi:hypothetical protein